MRLTKLLKLITIPILFVSNSWGQNLKMYINDSVEIVSEQTKFVKTIEGIGIAFQIEDTLQASDYVEIEMMHKSTSGSLVTLKRSRINNFQNKYSGGELKLWYSDNWLQGIPKGFIPLSGIQIPEKFRDEELNIIVFVYTGSESTAMTVAGKDRSYKRKTKRQMLLSSETFKIFQREWTSF